MSAFALVACGGAIPVATRPPSDVPASPASSQTVSATNSSETGYKNPTLGKALALQIPGMDKAREVESLEYSAPDGEQLLLDLYLPAQGSGPPPVVLLGGPPALTAGRSSGQKIGWAQLIAATGFAAAAFDIRSDDSQATPQAPSDDVAAAIAYLRDHGRELGIDAASMCTLGFSLGTAPWHVWAAMSEPDPYMKCNVIYYGPTDFEGAGYSIDPDVAPKYSAITYLRRDKAQIAPMLIAFGRNDEFAGIPESIDRFAELATTLKAPVTVLEHRDAGHGFDLGVGDARTREIIEATLDFFRSNLRPSN